MRRKRNGFDIAPQALLTAAGVIISIALISIMINQFTQARSVASAVADNMTKTANRLKENDVAQFDGMIVNGADVINFFKRSFSSDSEGDFLIVINNGVSEKEYCGRNGLEGLTDASSKDTYVRSTSRYKCRIIRNENGVILEAVFSIE